MTHWIEPKAWREGYTDALFFREYRNPYGWANAIRMAQYNLGYLRGQEVAAKMGIVKWL